MTDEPTAIGGRVTANVNPTTPRQTAGFRSAITARPEARLDGNSAVGRRVRDLFRGAMERLDNPADVVVQADVLAWAELKAAAEVDRARLLKGETQDNNALVRIENLVRRAEARVGLVPAAGAEEEFQNPFAALFDSEEETAE